LGSKEYSVGVNFAFKENIDSSVPVTLIMDVALEFKDPVIDEEMQKYADALHKLFTDVADEVRSCPKLSEVSGYLNQILSKKILDIVDVGLLSWWTASVQVTIGDERGNSSVHIYR
jgi:hypothetical protein